MSLGFPFQRQQIIITVTFLTFALALMGFVLELVIKETVGLLLSFVALGTGFDFLASTVGRYTKNKTLLLIFAKTRFSLLNFGVLFTPITAVFILSKFPTSSLCITLAGHYLYWLILSLASGSLFLFTAYTLDEEEGIPVFKLDRNDRFTKIAFIIRRIVLLCSLIIALIAVYEGLKTEYAVWSILFGGLFIATVPLHILHKHISSMVIELSTLVILFYGVAKVFLY